MGTRHEERVLQLVSARTLLGAVVLSKGPALLPSGDCECVDVSICGHGLLRVNNVLQLVSASTLIGAVMLSRGPALLPSGEIECVIRYEHLWAGCGECCVLQLSSARTLLRAGGAGQRTRPAVFRWL